MRSPKDIPTALSPAEARELRSFAEGMRVIEAGALLGFSTLLMAETAAKVISIDRHEGYGPSTLSAFLSNIEGRGEKIIPVIADVRSIIPFLRADRYFIDLDGTYETTKAVLEAIPFENVSIAIHDFGRNNCPGVERAIMECEGVDIDRVVDTLCFLRKR